MQISGQMPVLPVVTPDISNAKVAASSVAPESLVSTLAPAQPLEAVATTGTATDAPFVYARPRVRQLPAARADTEQPSGGPTVHTPRYSEGASGPAAEGKEGEAVEQGNGRTGEAYSRDQTDEEAGPVAGPDTQQSGSAFTGEEVDPAILAQIRQLSQTDRRVRQHEQAHASVGGQLAGAPTYDFTTGPDGRRYAVAGEVPIDASPVPGNPEATLRKMQQVRRAALAPADPSPQDRLVAAKATQAMLRARAELLAQQRERMRESAPPESQSRRDQQTALDTYRQLYEAGATSPVPDLAELIG